MGEGALPVESLGALLAWRAGLDGERPFLHHGQGDDWVAISFAEVLRRVERVAAALVELGIETGQRVGILAENRPEWLLADLGALSIGAVDVPLYPTSPAAEVGPILRRSGARLLFVSTEPQLDKLRGLTDSLPDLETVVVLDADVAMPPNGRLGARVRILPLAAFEALGTPRSAARARARRDAVRRDDLATLLFTSGTTGEPKGVMLSHGNFLGNVESVLEHMHIDADDRTLSFLPLSHCFERTAGHYTLLAAGGQIAYASSLERVPSELREVRPTLVLGVPRFFEKMRARILATVEKSHAYRRRLFHYALRVGRRAFEREQAGEDLSLAERWRLELVDRLVFSHLRDRIGGRVRMLVSGGAPLDPAVAEFFLHAGLRLVEGYGLTETAPVIACNTPEALRPGTVGRVLPRVEVRIAEDGEILVRGPNVMQGYFEDPRATAEVLEADGTFHTGDIGQFDAQGFLSITDRKKDLIITAGGKNVSPAAVENTLKRSGLIGDLCLVGDRRPYLVALLVPDFAALKRRAEELGVAWEERAESLRRPELRALFEDAVARANSVLAPPERVRRFALLQEPFSQENRLLTATLKVRRHRVEETYRDLIESLYEATPGDQVLHPTAEVTPGS